MKSTVLRVVALIFVIGIIAYIILNKKEEVEYESSPVIVDVIIAREELISKNINYLGSVQISSTEKISFKSAGRIEKLNGSEGDILEDGTEFIKLDTSDLELSLKASEQNLRAAKSQYNEVVKGAKKVDISSLENQVQKANEQVKYLEKLYNDTSTLYKSGFASEKDLTDLEFKLNLAKKDLSTAKNELQKAKDGASKEQANIASANVELARTDIKAKQSLIDDAKYVVKGQKVVVKTMFSEGELVPAGYVVAVIRDATKSVVIGVVADDLSSFSKGKKVEVKKGDKNFVGLISKISDTPNPDTFLYDIEVEMTGDDFAVGDIVEVIVNNGSSSYIKIPLMSVINDEIDYVYICDEENKVKIKQVKIIGEDKGGLLVEGLEKGDRVIIDNLSRINENDVVSVSK